MHGTVIFAVEVLGSLALSALVLARLQARLQRVGPEVCGRPGGAEFWITYTQLMMFIAPLMLVLMNSNGLYSAAGTIFRAAAWTT